MPRKIPNFTFSFSNPYHSNFGYISVDGYAVDILANGYQVYENLGYTEEVAKTGLLPDEFIWEEYTRDGAAKSYACMQAKIIEYLNTHSEIFQEKYGALYQTWAGICSSSKVGKIAACAACHMCPKHDRHAADAAPTNANTPAQMRYRFLKMVSALGMDENQADSPT